jgi:hypothetical protein
MRTKNQLPWFRDALTISALLLILPAGYAAQGSDHFQLLPRGYRRGSPLILTFARDRSRHVERKSFRPIRVWMIWPS